MQRAFLLLALALLTATGCDGPADDDCRVTPCAAGFACEAADDDDEFACVPRACDAETPCADGLTCLERGACGAECVAPAQEGEVCRAEEEGVACIIDVACADGLECQATSGAVENNFIGGACHAPRGLGEEGCAPSTPFADAAAHDGCIDGLLCEGATETCTEPCAADSDCDAPLVCSGTSGTPSSCSGCVAVAAAGERCHVIAGLGLDVPACEGATRPCADGLECGERVDDAFVCAPPAGAGASCNAAVAEALDGCTAGLRCVDDACVP